MSSGKTPIGLYASILTRFFPLCTTNTFWQNSCFTTTTNSSLCRDILFRRSIATLSHTKSVRRDIAWQQWCWGQGFKKNSTAHVLSYRILNSDYREVKAIEWVNNQSLLNSACHCHYTCYEKTVDTACYANWPIVGPCCRGNRNNKCVNHRSIRHRYGVNNCNN